MVCTTIDENGTITRKELFKNDELFYFPTPEENILLNDNSLLIRLERGKKERFDKIIIN